MDGLDLKFADGTFRYTARCIPEVQKKRRMLRLFPKEITEEAVEEPVEAPAEGTGSGAIC